jgi:uncharacterized protein YbjT (DUF2867 family)
MKALLVGASGATGKNLLELLLHDDDIQQVDVFVRRELNITHKKLNVHIINFDKPDEWEKLVTGDVLFSCLGTTIKAAGSKAMQWKIDYEYQCQFANSAQINGVPQYVLVSSQGASTKSLLFYSKMKGQLEEAVQKLNFSKLIIFRPPLLLRENSDRKGEVIGVTMINSLNKLGLLRSQKPLPTRSLAEAMLKSIKILKNGNHTIAGQKIKDWSKF